MGRIVGDHTGRELLRLHGLARRVGDHIGGELLSLHRLDELQWADLWGITLGVSSSVQPLAA